MKIDRTRSTSSAGKAHASRGSGEGFRLDMGEPSAGVAAATPVRGVSAAASVDAILALQGGGGESALGLALRRGRRIVDALDRLHLSMLGDGPTKGDLARLRGALGDAASPSGDPELDTALQWARVRVAVEAAKLERE
ncbi:hypothetical protein GC169_08355 [bacterium]|nr:hypothetical protein [bacterium]